MILINVAFRLKYQCFHRTGCSRISRQLNYPTLLSQSPVKWKACDSEFVKCLNIYEKSSGSGLYDKMNIIKKMEISASLCWFCSLSRFHLAEVALL